MYVGSAKQEYNVHEGLLTTHSPFFKAALGEAWAEGEARRISLPEDEPDTFGLYASWLYYRRICSTEEKNDFDGWKVEIDRLILAYILGEKLQDVDFKDAVIDAMISRAGTKTDDGRQLYPGPHAVKTLYESTTESSPVRQLMVDYYAFHAPEELLRKNKELPADFFRDLSFAFAARRNQAIESPPLRVDKCYYHAHKKGGSPCYKTSTTSCLLCGAGVGWPFTWLF